MLAGTGNDDTMGVRAVKGEGGMAMAQDPETTEHSGMPLNARRILSTDRNSELILLAIEDITGQKSRGRKS